MSAFLPDRIAAAARDEADRRMQQLLAQRAGVDPKLVAGYAMGTESGHDMVSVTLRLYQPTFTITVAELNEMRADVYRKDT